MAEKLPPSMAEMAIRIAERFGVPVVLMAVMIWLLREAAVTMHGTVVVPIVKSHTEFLDSTRQTLSEMSDTQRQQAEYLRDIAEGQHEIKQVIVTTKSSGNGG